MGKLKTKTGCMTCLVRKKKCDEARPQCRECYRLGLACISRSSGSQSSTGAVSLTNMRVRRPVVQAPISHGYPPFRNDLEKKFTLESPAIFHPLLWRFCDPGFRDFKLFGRFCTQDLLVREALVAFAGYGQGPSDGNSYKLALTSYQSCIRRLNHSEGLGSYEFGNTDKTLTAILFMGLLEGLRFGDPSNCVAHFEACRKLLTASLSDTTPSKDTSRLRLYQIVAECITFNLGNMSAFHADLCRTAKDWGTSFDGLFGNNDPLCSPFMGGFQGIYHVMFQTNLLLRHPRTELRGHVQRQPSDKALDKVWQELIQLERQLPALYSNLPECSETIWIYHATHRLLAYTQKIHLTKIARPLSMPSDDDIRDYFSRSIAVLKAQDVRVPGSPVLRWPLTILACAAETGEDFEFLTFRMEEMAMIIDPANSYLLRSALDSVTRVRRNLKEGVQLDSMTDSPITSALDLLLEPRRLNKFQIPPGT